MSTETLSEKRLATARSCAPSPLSSPTATDAGRLPAPKFRADWRLPSPLPSKTETFRRQHEVHSRAPAPSHRGLRHRYLYTDAAAVALSPQAKPAGVPTYSDDPFAQHSHTAMSAPPATSTLPSSNRVAV